MLVLRTTVAVALATILLAGCSAPDTASHRTAWQSLPLNGVSGLAPAGPDWVAIGDAKKTDEARAIAIRRNPSGVVQTRTLRWVGPKPVDLEAISAVPGTSDRFVAVTSRGNWFAVQLRNSDLQVIESGKLPNGGAIEELEGFNLARVGGRAVAVWGNRGSNKKPGRLFWSEWNAENRSRFGPVQSAEIRMPWPREDVRHLSDLHLASDGRLLVSSASDPGDKGPFASAVWEAGRFEGNDAGLVWRPLARPVQVLRDGPKGHKIEAVSADAAGRLVVASDDEALGSAIRF